MRSECAVQRFEAEFASFYNVPYVLAVNSGTSALIAAILALQVTRNKTVLVPAFSWPQLAAAPRALGYAVDFVDVDNDGRLDVEQLELKIGNDVGAVVVCHLFGNPSLASRCKQLAQEYGVPVVEDCSQALLARDNGRLVGTWGDFGFCSTGRNKLLSTDEGGLLWTSSPKLYARAYAFTQHNERSASNWLKQDTLFSSLSMRMHPYGARLGLKSLQGLEARLIDVSAFHEQVRCEMAGLPGVRIPQIAKGAKAVWSHCPVALVAHLKRNLKRHLWDRCAAYLLCDDSAFQSANSLAAELEYVKIGRTGKNEFMDKIKRLANRE